MSSSHTCQNKRPQPHLNHFYSIISTTRPKVVVMNKYPQHTCAGSRVKKQTACYVILKLLHMFSPHIQTYSKDIPLIIKFMLAVRDPSWLPGPLTLSHLLHSPCCMGYLGSVSQCKTVPCPAGAINCFLVWRQYRHKSWHTDLTKIWIKVGRIISKIFREKMCLLYSLKTYWKTFLDFL